MQKKDVLQYRVDKLTFINVKNVLFCVAVGFRNMFQIYNIQIDTIKTYLMTRIQS